MKICIATMVGPGSHPKEARESACDLVDGVVYTMPGKITDFAAARNELLKTCADKGYDWALMLDTDERIHWENPVTLKASEQVAIDTDNPHNGLAFVLGQTKHDMLHVWAADHSYAKPRFFRLPVKGKYVGPTHECWVADPESKVGTLEGITFSELPKTHEQYQAKAERDRDILEKYTKKHPDDPRWWYYLGDTYSGLGMDDEALQAFADCWSLNGWDEESAWAAYRVAEIFINMKAYNDALSWCCNGMARHSGMAELPWLAGFCCFHLGRYQQAIWWEQMAIALNKAKAAEHRINFRHEPALWEGPYDVMAHAHAAMGKDVSASADRILCDLYMGERLKSQKSRAPRT